MNISSNYCVCAYGYNQEKTNNQINKISGQKASFTSRYGEHKPTERTPWGTTWGEEYVAKREAEASKRAIQREILSRSEDPDVVAAAKRVGDNPAMDEYLTQREFDKYHEKVMAERAVKEAKLAAAAGMKKYDGKGNYTVADAKGRIIESGKGDSWETRYQYDIDYPVERYGEHYTMKGAVKETKPDNTYVIRVSPYSKSRLEEKFPNKSVEYVDNCTHKIKSVKLPDGRTFEIPMRLLTVKQTENSRQYFSQYDDKTVQLEVFDDGSYVQA